MQEPTRKGCAWGAQHVFEILSRSLHCATWCARGEKMPVAPVGMTNQEKTPV